jgi:hypothetical protein
MVAVTGVPTLVALVFLFANGLEALAWGTVAAATGPLAYLFVAERRPAR